jgi:hypothetical protein
MTKNDLMSTEKIGDCECREGFLPWTEKDGQITCYQEFLQGPCPDDHQVPVP